MKEKLTEGNVVIDGLYSLEEHLLLKREFPEMIVLCVYSSPRTRYERLSNRSARSLTPEEAEERDMNQLQNLHTGGPIALADFTITNEDSVEKLREQVKNFIKRITTE